MEKEYLLKKWLNNTLTPQELEEFKALEDFSENERILNEGQHFKASHFSTPEDFSVLKERLKTSSASKKYRLQPLLLKIAAVLIIAVGVTLFFLQQATTFKTEAGEQLAIQLPDHTQVIINARSSIKYNKSNWENERDVHLEGEAFFKVSKGKVFDVMTDQGVVTVVGTAFNVKHRTSFFEVSCYEGVVQVQVKGNKTLLYAGDTYKMINNTVVLDKINNQIPSWTNNKSEFNDVPFQEVVHELERQYNVTVIFNKNYNNQLFTGGFTHTNLENALYAITAPFNMTFVIKPDNSIRLQESETN